MKKVVIVTSVFILVFGAVGMAGDLFSAPITTHVGLITESITLSLLGLGLIGLARFKRKKLSNRIQEGRR